MLQHKLASFFSKSPSHGIHGACLARTEFEQLCPIHLLRLLVIFIFYFKLFLGALVGLLMTLVKLDGACCKESHLPLLFGAYQASLHQTDQKILQLIQIYENNGVKLQAFRYRNWQGRETYRLNLLL